MPVIARSFGIRILVLVTMIGLLPQFAAAVVIPLGNSGWEAVFDDGLDPFVDIVVNSETTEAVFIRKSAEFTQPSQMGIFPTIPIVFRQTSATAVPFIVIDDEVITNSTGEPWLDFHLDVAAGGATFDITRTANSGGPGPIGFAISPFTNAVFADNTALDIDGGPGIPSGGVWTPGAGPSGGQLWIAANPRTSEPFTLFTIKEVPTIPEPASIALLALGGLALIPRRKR